MSKETVSKYNQVLDHLTDGLDISPTKYKQAVERYTAVGNWLNEGTNGDFDVSIYPQGSFRLGTVIRPWRDGVESDYDIDLVCELQVDKTRNHPAEIKKFVGDRLKENADYKRMLEPESSRCWTIHYADGSDGIGFHMDILPSVPEDIQSIQALVTQGVPSDIANQAIAIVDNTAREGYSWTSSNPNGFADWFDQINQLVYRTLEKSQKNILFESNRELYEMISDVPNQLVRTPLQRSIQILKRHRDTRFSKPEWNDAKPMSMIITTLSARLYQNQSDTYSTLQNIVLQLSHHAKLLETDRLLKANMADFPLITRLGNEWYVPNPVNPEENFAENWHEDNHRKARAFFQWVKWIESDILQVSEDVDSKTITKSLNPFFGEGIVKEAVSKTFPASPAFIIRQKDKADREVSSPEKPWRDSGY